MITDSKQKTFDNELLEVMLKYKNRNAYNPEYLLLTKHISNMNINVHERIKSIMVNMERSRWISPSLTKTEKSIIVNIPSFTLTYFKEGKPVLVSKVVVGK